MAIMASLTFSKAGMSHWLEDAVIDGLALLDVEEAIAAQVVHLSREGEWRKGVISPSLVATQCPLARVKIFLGLDPVPGQKPRMALRAGRPDAVSLINMVRGFDGEGLILAALQRTLPSYVQATAPTLKVEWHDPETGYQYAGHPDLLGLNDDDDYELMQIKTPSVFKLDRVEKKGDSDALESYLPQMATEMFITRMAGTPVVRSHLLLFSWEGTPKLNRPRIRVVTLEWDRSLATIPQEAARQIYDTATQAMVLNLWPQAFPATSWDVWPCSYCRYARLGDFEVPACDDHQRWKK